MDEMCCIYVTVPAEPVALGNASTQLLPGLDTLSRRKRCTCTALFSGLRFSMAGSQYP